jgi:hypothetical protein
MGSLDKSSKEVGVAVFIMQKGSQVRVWVAHTRREAKDASMLHKGAAAR